MTPQWIGILVLVVAMAVESFAQMFLKFGASGAPRAWSAAKNIATRSLADWPGGAWVAAGVIAYGLEILLYTVALHFLDVSVAFPLGSLCFVGVALLSRIFLGEAVGRVRWLGVGCILAGAAFLTL